MTHGGATAPAACIGAFTYASVLFAAVYGRRVWGERRDLRGLNGAWLSVIAGVLSLHRRHQPA